MTSATLETREQALAQIRHRLEVFDRLDVPANRPTSKQRFNHLVSLVSLARVRVGREERVVPALLIGIAAQAVRWLEEDYDREEPAA